MKSDVELQKKGSSEELVLNGPSSVTEEVVSRSKKKDEKNHSRKTDDTDPSEKLRDDVGNIGSGINEFSKFLLDSVIKE